MLQFSAKEEKTFSVRTQLERRASSLLEFGGSGSDDDNDPTKRRWKAVSKSCIDTSISLIRELILNLVVDTTNESLRAGLANPSTQKWNSAIRTALEERFGHSRYNWRRIAHFLIVSSELTMEGEQSPFFLKVIDLVKEH